MIPLANLPKPPEDYLDYFHWKSVMNLEKRESQIDKRLRQLRVTAQENAEKSHDQQFKLLMAMQHRHFIDMQLAQSQFDQAYLEKHDELPSEDAVAPGLNPFFKDHRLKRIQEEERAHQQRLQERQKQQSQPSQPSQSSQQSQQQ